MTFYLPILPGPYGAKSQDKWDCWISETPLVMLTREDVVADIERGQIDPPPARVLAINEAAGTVIDVTADIAHEVGKATFGQGYNASEPFPALRDWLELHKADFFEQRELRYVR